MRAVASVARVFGDFDLAEDAVQDAYLIALERWPREGTPRSPAGWIVTTARSRALDRLRRAKTAASKHDLIARLEALTPQLVEEPRMDDRLGMIFAACHPALELEARITLTLRFAAGLTVEEIATALLLAKPTVAQRLVRAKHKIADARIPFALPEDAALPQRLNDVLLVAYLIFNEGYASSTNPSRIRADLCEEAQRLTLLLEGLLPAEPEIAGLHALMLFHDARRETRIDQSGEAVLLEDQDRLRWDTRKILLGLNLLETAQRHRAPGPYQLQASIASEHARAPTWEATNWFRIRAHYDALYALDPTPVVALNRSIAIAYTEGDEAGLLAVDSAAAAGALEDYGPLYAARAELLRRLGRREASRDAYRRAIELTRSEPERRFLRKRLNEAV